jgi:hypothetical protein
MNVEDFGPVTRSLRRTILIIFLAIWIPEIKPQQTESLDSM